MNGSEPLDILPLWALYLLTVLLSLAMIEVGYRLGKAWQRRSPDTKEGSVGALTGATLGLLAFLLAFLTGIALGRFDTRRHLVVEESNAIGTAYLRAGFLDEPYRSDIRALLAEYVDQRLLIPDRATLTAARARSEQIQSTLWGQAEILARANPESVMVALFIQSINDVIDIHSKRIAAINGRVPPTIWLMIFVVTVLAMLIVGIQSSYSGQRHIFAMLAMVLVFSAVVLLIADLDRPYRGLLKVSQQPMLDLQQQLAAPGP